MLASGGVNAEQLSSNINSVNLAGTFEPLVPLSDTDVEVRAADTLVRFPRLLFGLKPRSVLAQGYIRHTHEQAIISAIEEGRRATTADFYRNLDTKMRRDWEKQKDRLFEELGRHHPAAGPSTESSSSASRRGNSFERAVSRREGVFRVGQCADTIPHLGRAQPTSFPSTPASGGGSLQMHSKMMRYDRVIRRLNEFRKEGFAFGLVSALGEASIGSTAGDSVRGHGDEHYFPGRELTP